VLLPTPLVRHGKLDREVTVIGNNDHLEIWDRAAWAERLEGIEGSADNVAQRLAEQRS
jgi:DNA-binding transcriptional regulator/RsmH inhibitor MraZ